MRERAALKEEGSESKWLVLDCCFLGVAVNLEGVEQNQELKKQITLFLN